MFYSNHALTDNGLFYSFLQTDKTTIKIERIIEGCRLITRYYTPLIYDALIYTICRGPGGIRIVLHMS